MMVGSWRRNGSTSTPSASCRKRLIAWSMWDMWMERSSMGNTTRPGTTLTAPGSTESVPTVQVIWGSISRLMASIRVMRRQAWSSASSRRSMGVLPAWLASPRTVTMNRAMPTMPSTIPAVMPSRSRTPPCSTWSSR